MAVRRSDLHLDQIASLQSLGICQIHHTVDLRRICHGSGDGLITIHCIDQHGFDAADPLLQFGRTDGLLHFHETGQALLLDLFRHLIRQGVGGGTIHCRISKAADAIQLRFFEEIEQLLEILLGLAGESGNKGAADRQVRTDRPPGADPLDVSLARGRAASSA